MPRGRVEARKQAWPCSCVVDLSHVLLAGVEATERGQAEVLAAASGTVGMPNLLVVVAGWRWYSRPPHGKAGPGSATVGRGAGLGVTSTGSCESERVHVP